MDADRFSAISIILAAPDRTLLSISLSADGSLQRMGSGRLSAGREELLFTRIPETVFSDFRRSVPAYLTEESGAWDIPQKSGTELILTLMFSAPEETVELRFRYGSESEGPPDDVVRVVHALRSATDPWYPGPEA